MSPPIFPLLEALKSHSDPLTIEEVLRVGVHEDPYFCHLYKAMVVCSLGVTDHFSYPPAIF